MLEASSWPFPLFLERIRAGLAGANAHDLFEIRDEDLPVADLAGVGGLLDRFDDAIEQVVFDGGFDLHLRQEIDDVFGAAIELGVPLLPAESLDLGDGNPLHADSRQCLANFVELERLDDGGNEFHGVPPVNEMCAETLESLLHVADELVLRDVLAIDVRVERILGIRAGAVDAEGQAVDFGRSADLPVTVVEVAVVEPIGVAVIPLMAVVAENRDLADHIAHL